MTRPPSGHTRSHTCTSCPATGTGAIAPPGWQWLGSKLLCQACYNELEPQNHG